MTLISYSNFLYNTFAQRFPAYTVKINRDYDDAKCLFVSIYGVPGDAVDGVESMAYGIIKDEIVPRCDDFMPTLEVVDVETTRRYYPAQIPLRRAREKTTPVFGMPEKTNSRLVAAY